MSNPVITFARWGNYTIAFKGLFEGLGFNVILPPKPSSAVITEGAKIAPELFCFPMKVTLGGYLAAIKSGADVVFSIQNVGGSCRQKYYGLIQKKALEESGHKIRFIDFRATPKEVYSLLKKETGLPSWKILLELLLFFRKLFLIEKMEKLAQYTRPREIQKGESDKAFREGLAEIEQARKLKDFSAAKQKILTRFSAIKIDRQKDILKVALFGEIYTVSDSAVNFDLESKMGREGIEVSREMNVSYQMKKLLFPWKDWFIQQKIKNHLETTVGGHGRDAIYEMLHYIENDFDGAIQVLPFGCMPEVTVRPILEKIRMEKGLPFLSLSLDEQVAEAGIETRLEAFADVVRNYHQKKKTKQNLNPAALKPVKTEKT